MSDFAPAVGTPLAAAQTEVKFGHVGAPGSLFAQSAALSGPYADSRRSHNSAGVKV